MGRYTGREVVDNDPTPLRQDECVGLRRVSLRI